MCRVVAIFFLLCVGFFGVLQTWSSESSLFGENSVINDGFPWRNGDHMYYVSSGLQFAGVGYKDSLELTKLRFPDYPFPGRNLDYGYTDPTIAPMIFPRVTLPIAIGLTYSIFGISFVWIPSMIAGLLSLLLIYRWTKREWGATAGYFSIISGIGSVLFVKYGTGLFIESFVILIMSALLFALPFSTDRKPQKFAGITTGLLLAVLALTRQIPQLPILILLFGSIVATLSNRSLLNDWTRISIKALPVTWLSYTLVSQWAPLRSYGYLDVVTNLYQRLVDNSAVFLFLSSIPEFANQSAYQIASIKFTNLASSNLLGFGTELIVSYWHSDPWLLWIVFFFAFGAFSFKRSYVLIGFVGALSAAIVNALFATAEYRYWSIVLPFVMPLCGLGVVRFIGLFMTDSKRLFSAQRVVQADSKMLWRTPVLLSTLLIFTISLTLFRFWPQERVSTFSVPTSEQVSTALGAPGSYLCFEDDGQIFLKSSSGKLIPLSGTALSHSFWNRGDYLTYINAVPPAELAELVQFCIDGVNPPQK